MGLMGHKKEAHQPTRGWCAPPWAGGQIGICLGGLSFLSPSSFPLLLIQQGREGLLLARLLLAGRTSPLLLYIRGRGHPIDTTIDH